MAGYQSTQNYRASVVFTDDLPHTEVPGPPGEVKSSSGTMPLQLQMFHIRGPDIEGTDKCHQLEQMAGYRSTQNFRAYMVFTDDLPQSEVSGPPGEVKSSSGTMPLQLQMFHIRGQDTEGKRNITG